MSGMGMDWYKREPAAYLKDTQGLSMKEHAVYAVVLDLIYAHGGSVNNDPRWISGWISDMGAASVRRAIESLEQRGILICNGDQITQKRARNEAKTKEIRRETARETGRIGGKKSAEIRSSKSKNKDIAKPKPSTPNQPEKRREEQNPPLPPKGDGDLFPVPDRQRPRTPADHLEPILGRELAEEFVRHRKGLKKPMTERAGELMASKLRKHPNPRAAIEEAIMNGWQGVYDNRQPSRQQPHGGGGRAAALLASRAASRA